jgi:hypothetical protein
MPFPHHQYFILLRAEWLYNLQYFLKILIIYNIRQLRRKIFFFNEA